MLVISARVDAPEGYVVDLVRVMSLPCGLTYPDSWRYTKDLVSKDLLSAVAAGQDLRGRDVLVCAGLPVEGGGVALAPLRRGTIQRVELDDILSVAFSVGEFVQLPDDDQLIASWTLRGAELAGDIADSAVETLSFTTSLEQQKTEWARTISALQRDTHSNGAFDRTLFSFAWLVDKHGKEPSKGVAETLTNLGEVRGYQLTAGDKYELLWKHRAPGFGSLPDGLPEVQFKLSPVPGLTSGSGTAVVRGAYHNQVGWALYPTKTEGKMEYLEFGLEGTAPDNTRIPETKLPVVVRFSQLNLIRQTWWRYALLAVGLWVGIMWSIFASTKMVTTLSLEDILTKFLAHWPLVVGAFIVALGSALVFVLQKGYGKS